MIEIPEGVNVNVSGQLVTVKGPAGEVQKAFGKGIGLKLNGKAVEISAKNKALTNTCEALFRCMFHGVTKGYKRSMKLLYAHFPISIEVKGKDVTIKNFLGEKQPRKTVLVGTTKLEAKGQNVTVSGSDKEALGQTIANLRTAMRIKDKDGRVFQDGLYDVEAE